MSKLGGGADGPTLNDDDDPDSGANNLQNFPDLTAASTFGGTTTVQGSLNSTPSSTFRLEFFASPTGDPSGHGEGKVFIGSINVTTDGSGNAAFLATFFVATTPGHVVTATATDAAGNTSEFSNSVSIVDVPSSEGCKVTNGGGVTALNGDKAKFGGNAQASGEGQEQYQDHGPAEPINVHSIDVQAVVCSDDGKMASIFGTATIDGAGSYGYRIDVQDNGEPGKNDTYRIRLSNGYDSGEQQLEQGNVQIHQ